MPGGDRTGPMGQGPRTGRAAGYCAGFDAPGYANLGFGFGRGRGAWGGRGHRHMFWATGQPGWARFGWGAAAYPASYPEAPAAAPRNELQMLKAQAEYYGEILKDVQDRISELEQKSKTEK